MLTTKNVVTNYIFSQKNLYKLKPICYNILYNKKGGDNMKIIFNVPVDIDELIFAEGSTVPSER